ncbi:hypothetical protein [Paractinoplanes atraurantiacus]|uniref:Lipoprotein LprG n=1 Tax=Paractinoplanes atraurantiacus TaxID=1036182 RepID=A0A285FC48_9ACTN|nr:hypothetical protein [Actinoplanes atraurantiacus]SNY08314.1 hypothetical protein SAMN05421748_101840 [Actinoplanes atraurantiacus]
MTSIRRPAIAGLTLAAVLVAGGCSGDSKTDTKGASPAGDTTVSAAPPATTAPASASEELTQAYAKFSDTPVKFELASAAGIAGTGAIDAKTKSSEMTTDLASAGSMVTRQIGKDLYVKTEGQVGDAIGATAGKWMHIDVSQVPDSSPISIKNTDPANTAKLITTASEVTKTGDHTFKGTLDMTKSATANATMLKALGAKAKAVPFTAETDAEGRLTKLSMALESIAPGAGEMTATYSNWGEPVNVAKPAAGEVVEMPAKFRKAMGA